MFLQKLKAAFFRKELHIKVSIQKKTWMHYRISKGNEAEELSFCILF